MTTESELPKILIIDNDPKMNAFLQEVLGKKAQLFIATSEKEARETFYGHNDWLIIGLAPTLLSPPVPDINLTTFSLLLRTLLPNTDAPIISLSENAELRACLELFDVVNVGDKIRFVAAASAALCATSSRPSQEPAGATPLHRPMP